MRALLQSRLDLRSLGGQVVLNSGWLIGERVLRMGVAFIVTIWTIRYLGAEQYGVLAYALSLIMLVDVVATMGMRSVVVRELVDDPDREWDIVGTTLGVKLGTSLVAAVVLVAFGWWTARGSDTFAVLTVLAIAMPINAFSAFDLTFQANLQSQYAVAARISGLLVATLLRVTLLLVGAPLIAFAIASALELAVIGVAFAVMYGWKRLNLTRLRFSVSRARSLLAMSWPLFLSALAAGIYLKIDQVMLHALTTSTEVGHYAAAARISEVWYFIPVAMASSLLPMLVRRHREDPEAYEASLQRAFDVNVWMALSLSIGITVVAGFAINVLYGADFAPTIDILRIHTWAAPFLFLSTVLGRALIAEDRRRFELTRHVSGALLNIVLNLALIPLFGGIGAAVATVISYGVAAYLVCAVYPPTRFHLRLMTRAFLWPLRLLRRPPAAGDLDVGGPDEEPPGEEDGRRTGVRPHRRRDSVVRSRRRQRR